MPPTPAPNALAHQVPRAHLRKAYGVCDATIDAWIEHEGFPRPAVIRGRHYFNVEAVNDWFRQKREGRQHAE
jgi:hypothetical protein